MRDTEKTVENLINKQKLACIYFCDQRFFRGIMLKGTMEVLEDVESKEMLWVVL